MSDRQSDGAGGQNVADDQIDLLQIFEVMWRGKWRILFCMIAAILIGGYYAFKVAVPLYSSTAWLAIQVNSQQVIDLESVVSGISTEDAAINTELQIIKSRDLVQKLVREMNLVEDPEFNSRLREPSVISSSYIKNKISSYFKGENSEGSTNIPVTTPEYKRNVEISVTSSVNRAISVAAKANTYLYSITVQTGDPKKSSEMANRLAKIYLDDQINVKFTTTEFAVNWLSSRVSELELELNQKEDAIKNLRADTDLVSVDVLEALNIRAKDIRQRVMEMERSISDYEKLKVRVAALVAEQNFSELSALLGDPRLRDLLRTAESGTATAAQQFLDRVAQVEATRAQSAEREALQLAALQNSYEQILNEISDQSTDLVELNQLVREADATRVLYETFLTRLKETSVQVGLQRADSRILTGAIPGYQIAPRKSLILVTSAMIGTIVGVSIILLQHFLQSGFRASNEVEKVTGYRVLGQIPLISVRRRAGMVEYITSNPTSAAAEAIRNLRTSVLLSNVDTPPQLIMSTSSIPGEGKTTQSIFLAHNLSGLGKSVLLIEGDIRRRTLSEYFKGEAEGNLVSVVSGEQSLSESVIHDAESQIDILLGAKASVNAADFFSSDKFKSFVEKAREEYDYIVIDTPPVLVVPDARVIGQHADSIIFAVKWNSTSQFQVVEGLRLLSTVGLNVSGVVLSQIDPKGMKRYGYGGRYGAYANYGAGYYDA